MLERIFSVKNNSWKEFMQPGEVTREGFLPYQTNIFIAQEGVNFSLYIEDNFSLQLPEEEWKDIQDLINASGKIGVKIIAISGTVVKAELIIKRELKEFIYLINLEEAENLLKLCIQPIQTYCKYLFGMKKSYYGLEDPQVWWVKDYSGPYSGIRLTGVELKAQDETLIPPDWVGKEVANDPENFEGDLMLLKPTKIEEILGMYPV